jgi:aerobic carbon-monoxide dehydrogenase small subunit
MSDVMGAAGAANPRRGPGGRTGTAGEDPAREREEYAEIALTVNGVPRSAAAPPRRLLSDFLRHDLGLTGTHVGCEHGVCGCCTVLLDGAPVRSCLLFAVSVAGQEITTVEGLAEPDGSMSPVQRAFHECHALQCGFCTPGFLVTCTAFLRDRAEAAQPPPTDAEIVEAISGNLCRCTGYQNIVRAVHRAAELTADGEQVTPGGPGGPAAPGERAATPATEEDPR